jgi:histone H3/H4
VSLESSRDSDIRLGVLPGDDTENTFVFTVPPREVLDLQQSDDTVESPIRDDGENNDFGDLDATAPEDAEEVWNPVHEDVELSIMESTLQDTETAMANTRKVPRKKRIKMSKYGIQYPSLPAGVIKKLATTYARTSGNSKAKISKDTLDAIMQATDWFFEQVSDDLGAYAEHAGRKTIEESDVITLMGRYISPTRKAAISNSTCLQTAPDKYYSDTFLIGSKVSPSRAASRIADGPSFKNKKRPPARAGR